MKPLVFIRRDASHKKTRSRLISLELDVTRGASGTVFIPVFHISCYSSSPTFLYGDMSAGERRATEAEVRAEKAADDNLKIKVWLRRYSWKEEKSQMHSNRVERSAGVCLQHFSHFVFSPIHQLCFHL